MSERTDSEIDLLLAAARTIADSIATTFGADCEVAVHDLRIPTASLVHLANGQVSGRKLGSPIRDLLLRVIPQLTPGSDVVGTYATDLDDGRRLKSAACILRDSEGTPTVALCINLDISKLRDASGALESLVRIEDESVETFTERTPRDVPHAAEVMNHLIANVVSHFGPGQRMSKRDRIRAVAFLEEKGAFLIKGSVPLVAEALGVSEPTVYRYLEQSRLGMVEDEAAS
jgi:predicted transcriptional regulator YheO